MALNLTVLIKLAYNVALKALKFDSSNKTSVALMALNLNVHIKQV